MYETKTTKELKAIKDTLTKFHCMLTEEECKRLEHISVELKKRGAL